MARIFDEQMIVSSLLNYLISKFQKCFWPSVILFFFFILVDNTPNIGYLEVSTFSSLPEDDDMGYRTEIGCSCPFEDRISYNLLAAAAVFHLTFKFDFKSTLKKN